MESQIQRQILKYLNSLPNCVAWKIQSGNERGIPDVLACYRGCFVGIEVKCPGLNPTPIQRAQMDRVVAADGVAATARCVDDVRGVLAGVNASLRDGANSDKP